MGLGTLNTSGLLYAHGHARALSSCMLFTRRIGASFTAHVDASASAQMHLRPEPARVLSYRISRYRSGSASFIVCELYTEGGSRTVTSGCVEKKKKSSRLPNGRFSLIFPRKKRKKDKSEKKSHTITSEKNSDKEGHTKSGLQEPDENVSKKSVVHHLGGEERLCTRVLLQTCWNSTDSTRVRLGKTKKPGKRKIKNMKAE